MLNRVVVLILMLFAVGSGAAFGQAGTTRDLNKRPRDFLTPGSFAAYMKTKAYRQKHEQLEQDFWSLLDSAEKDEVFLQDRVEVMRVIISDTDFLRVANIRYWCARHAPEIIPDLINLITDEKIVGLIGFAELWIAERVQSGDFRFYDHHGGVIEDDLSLVAGRASWILSEITGRRFGEVSVRSSSSQRKKLSELWFAWLKKQEFTSRRG